MAVKPIPDGFHTITPYLLVSDAGGLIDFLKRAFGAEEIHRSAGPDGSVVHAQMQIGDSMIMMGQAKDEWKAMPCMLYLYVEDVDAWYRRAIEAGGTSVREVNDEAYGDRAGGVLDPAGNQWWVATHKQDTPLTPA
ncbi:MAG: PhnB protein [Acidobacteriota bacterium]|nr:PhnB protein [Acidobacteriota bacterium]